MQLHTVIIGTLFNLLCVVPIYLLVAIHYDCLNALSYNCLNNIFVNL